MRQCLPGRSRSTRTDRSWKTIFAHLYGTWNLQIFLRPTRSRWDGWNSYRDKVASTDLGLDVPAHGRPDGHVGKAGRMIGLKTFGFSTDQRTPAEVRL